MRRCGGTPRPSGSARIIIRVLDAYRRVFEKYPATRQGEESLLRAGELLTLLFRWTGQEGDLNQARNYYQRLIQTSPKSALADEARRRIKRLAGLAAADKPAQTAGPVTAAAPAAISSTAARRSSPCRRRRSSPCRAPTIIEMPPASDPLPPKHQVSPSLPGNPGALNRVRDIRHWSNPEYSRVVIDLDQKTNFYSNLLEDRSGSGQPPRLYIDLFTSLVEERLRKPILVNDGILLGIRAGQFTPDSVRVVLEIDGLGTYRVFPMQNPFRIVVDVTGGAPGAAPTPRDTGGSAPAPGPHSRNRRRLPRRPRRPWPLPHPRQAPGSAPAHACTALHTRAGTRTHPDAVVHDRRNPAHPGFSRSVAAGCAAGARTPRHLLRRGPGRRAARHRRHAAAKPAPAPARGARPAPGVARSSGKPAPAGKPSLARQLGLGVRRVVIDAGHGAHDPGAIGIGGLQEKDVTLDLALRVRDLLRTAGYETVLTRDRDVYLPLEERTALANTARGDLFLSLHCNASDAGNLSGVETYFLNLASNVRSMQTAARENSMAVANMSDLQQIVREIQNSKMDESSQFAARIQRSLHDTLRRRYPDVKNLGVKQAPFYVLIGAQMPSVLAEVSFINHRTEGRRLADPAYRQLIAQALVDGVKRYVRTVKTAALALPVRPTP